MGLALARSAGVVVRVFTTRAAAADAARRLPHGRAVLLRRELSPGSHVRGSVDIVPDDNRFG